MDNNDGHPKRSKILEKSTGQRERATTEGKRKSRAASTSRRRGQTLRDRVADSEFDIRKEKSKQDRCSVQSGYRRKAEADKDF